jgi:hypothetical protein
MNIYNFNIFEIIFITLLVIFSFYNINNLNKINEQRYFLSKKDKKNLKNNSKLCIENEDCKIFNVVEHITFFKEIKFFVFFLNKNRIYFKNQDEEYMFGILEIFPLELNNEKDLENNLEEINKVLKSNIENYVILSNYKDKMIILDNFIILKIKNKFYKLDRLMNVENDTTNYYNYGKNIKDTSLKNLYKIYNSNNEIEE